MSLRLRIPESMLVKRSKFPAPVLIMRFGTKEIDEPGDEGQSVSRATWGCCCQDITIDSLQSEASGMCGDVVPGFPGPN